MNLPEALVSQFVKITKDETKPVKETVVYGTVVKLPDSVQTYVRIDGADSYQYTPVISTTSVKNNDRVTVMIKDHTATITGNLSDPAATGGELLNTSGQLQVSINGLGNRVTEAEKLIADSVVTGDLSAQIARINQLEATDVVIKRQLQAADASIQELIAYDVTITGELDAAKADIDDLSANKLDAEVAAITYATVANLEAAQADIYSLEATYGEFVDLTTEHFSAIDADIIDLQANKLSVKDAELTYANIDFSNISKATMEWFYANSGLIENVTVGDGTITGRLVGVTITGDLIEANTLVADKLVILGDDGLYYKLNTNGVTTEMEQTEYNSLNGQIILAKSITATQISVSDLVAFDATIGGFTISDNAIYSEVKDSESNTTRGIYMDTDGQLNFGDASNYVRYYRDDNGNYRLAISADTILYDINGTQHSLSDLGIIGEYVKIATYEGEPCIELGESDSDFKLLITNTRILFMEGTGVPAYFTKQSMHIKKAVIEEELQQGGFVWKVRANGNLGLVWKGVSS